MRSKLRVGAEVAGRAAMNLSRSWSYASKVRARGRKGSYALHSADFSTTVVRLPSNRARQGRLDRGAVNATTSAFPHSWLESRYHGLRSPSTTRLHRACHPRP